jgi:hypothetical protein
LIWMECLLIANLCNFKHIMSSLDRMLFTYVKESSFVGVSDGGAHSSTNNLTQRCVQLAVRKSWWPSLLTRLARVMVHGSLLLATAPQRRQDSTPQDAPERNCWKRRALQRCLELQGSMPLMGSAITGSLPDPRMHEYWLDAVSRRNSC